MDDEWDIITLTGLSALGRHGVYDFERVEGQTFTADFVLYIDSRLAAETDDVAHTVDYSKIAEDAIAVLTGPPVALIETLAFNLAEKALVYPAVRKVEVTVHKPMAPIQYEFSDVSVTIVRDRDQIKKTLVKRSEPVHRVQGKEIKMENTDFFEDVPTPKMPQAESSSSRLSTEVATPMRSRAAATRSRKEQAGKDSGRPYKQVAHRRSRLDTKNVSRQATRTFDGYVYKVVLSLGANKGTVVENLAGAVEALVNLDQFEVDAVSPLVRTEPVLEPGSLPQSDYLNAVVLGRTSLAPPALLFALQQIEADFGRTRKERWGSRTLDIDIIDLDGMRLSTRFLTVPHPRAGQRAFVLYPWSLVDKQAVIAGSGKVIDLLRRAPDLGGILTVSEDWLIKTPREVVAAERPVQLAPRRTPRRPGPPAATDTEKVTLKGEEVSLVPLEGDEIFRKLLERQRREKNLVSRERAQSAPPKRVKAPPKPAVAVPAAVKPTQSKPIAKVAPAAPAAKRVAPAAPAAKRVAAKAAPPVDYRPQKATQKRSAEREPSRHEAVVPPADRSGPPKRSSRREQLRPKSSQSPALPNWDFYTTRTEIRVVDAVDRSVADQESPQEALGRGASRDAEVRTKRERLEHQQFERTSGAAEVPKASRTAEVPEAPERHEASQAAAAAATPAAPRVLRKRTVRPSPTGAIPLQRTRVRHDSQDRPR